MEPQHVLQQMSISEEDMPAALSSLAVEAFQSYERTGSMREIDLAVISAQAAMETTKESDLDRVGRMSNLGAMLESRYTRTGNVADLEEAISVAQQAVAATPHDHPNRAACLNNLGNILVRRYERTGATADLEEATGVARQAVAATPYDHINDTGLALGGHYANNAGQEGRKTAAKSSWHNVRNGHCIGGDQGTPFNTSYERPSVDQVLEELQRCCTAHFACHGITDHIDPSQSGQILQRQGEEIESSGSVGPVQDRLTVARISDVSLRHARLAYLSACSTAHNEAERLSDEVIHVVSGFLVAGFPHVVGCLWPSNDRVCAEVATGFYSSLFEQGGSQWQDGQMAAELREAVMRVRADEMAMPLNWAQLVHYGP